MTSRRRARSRRVRLWRKGGVDTIEALNKKDRAEDFKGLRRGRALRATGAIAAWLDELMRTLENELTTLCVRAACRPERMSLTGAKVDAGLSGVKLSLLDAMGMISSPG